MTFLPILQRELRARARRPGTYWSRTAIAGVAFIICLPVLLGAGGWGGPADLGRALFSGLVSAGFLLSCATCLLTFNAVDSEQRQGTLGLLLLTRVTGVDLLLGKLGSGGIIAVLGVLAITPALMVPMLAGGVTGGEAGRNALTLLNTCFVALSAGLLLSVSRRKPGYLWGLAFLLFIVLVGLPALDGVFGLLGARRQPSELTFGLLSPITTMVCASDSSYKTAPGPFWVSLAVGHAAGWCMVMLAGHRLQSRLHRGYTSETLTLPGHLAQAFPSAQRVNSFPSADEQFPIAWLARRQRGVKAALWTAAILVALHQFLQPILYARLIGPRAWASISFLLAIPSIAGSILTSSLVAWAASRFFAELRANGDLEVLTSTPAGATGLLTGHWRALRSALWGPVAVMLLPHGLGMMQLIWSSNPLAGVGVGLKIYIVGSHLVNPLITIIVAIAMCWLGQWLGLVARHRTVAILGAVTLVKVVPYMAALALQIGIQQLRVGFNAATFAIYLVPQAIYLIFPVVLIVIARQGTRAALSRGHLEAGLLQTLINVGGNVLLAVRRARRWVPQ